MVVVVVFLFFLHSLVMNARNSPNHAHFPPHHYHIPDHYHYLCRYHSHYGCGNFVPIPADLVPFALSPRLCFVDMPKGQTLLRLTSI